MSIISAIIGSIQGAGGPPPSPSYDANWTGSFDEGSYASLNVIVNNFPGGRVWWKVEGYGGTPINTSSDIDSGQLSGFYDFGNVTYNSQSVTTIYWKADHLTEGSEYFHVKLGSTDGGSEYGTYGPWAINDTSITPPPTYFDLVNPPQNVNLLPWVDSVSGVSATVVDSWTAPSDHGGAIGLTGGGYIEVNYINTASTFTLSLAADFQPAGVSWNSIYSGGDYGGSQALAYFNGSSMNVGTGANTFSATTTDYTGLAWWDFVYDGPSSTINVYKNGVFVRGTIFTGNAGFASKMWIGQRHGSITDYLIGNIYRIRYNQIFLDQTAITAQYDSIKSTYGLP